MFRKQHKKRSTNILFVIFRLILSLIIFAVLVGGMYAAYKQFSGMDPLKIDPQAVLKNILAVRTPKEFINVLSLLKIDPKILGQKTSTVQQSVQETSQTKATIQSLSFRFMIVTDSHNDNSNLQKALKQARENFPDLKFIIGLGDYTDVGTTKELKDAKMVLDNAGLRYFLIPGDHDLWDCRNRSLPATSCFREVFGPDYQSFVFEDYKFILLNNSDNYVGFSEEQSVWIEDELGKAKVENPKGILIFLHEPLSHPSSDHVMGWVEKNLKTQAGSLIFQLKESGVKQVFAGDIHYFSKYREPGTNLSMATIGAAGIERNPQSPRFAVVSIFDDGEIGVDDVEIK